MKKTSLLVLICFIQGLFADEYVLNESALHVDARDFALGGLVCRFEPIADKKMEITYLMPFQLKELSVRKLEFHKKALSLDWSLGWYQSGNEDWMENRVGLQVGKQLSKQLYLGVALNVLALDNSLEGPLPVCFAELECEYVLSEKVTLGLTLMNPSGVRVKSGNDFVPLSSAAFLGARYCPARKCLLFCELDVRLNNPIRERAGLEYVLNNLLILRTGFSTGPLMPSWGIGGTFNRWSYSWGGNLHPILGVSNGFTLNFCW
ncbi:MAG: hypothetical protein NTY32_02575 [Bacteroidia bacterium]|nr:hypothetical protein [Bacteroidia bacterium]